MTPPTAPGSPDAVSLAAGCSRREAERVLRESGEALPDERFGLPSVPRHTAPRRDAEGALTKAWDEALATSLMDCFRRTRADAAFAALVGLATPGLLRRARNRVRFTHGIDAHEVVQDAFVNVYRYPEKFAAARPGAFRAWASTIVDNAVRRQLRRARSGPELLVRPNEVLGLLPDAESRQPASHAQNVEACRHVLSAYRLVLSAYLGAFATLGERERLVLQLVEVAGLRYGEIAPRIGVRAEALKMVVFRARRRIFDRMNELLTPAETEAAAA